MAFSALKPCSRIMRASPHQSDQQEKEAYSLLLLQEEEVEDAKEDPEALHRKSLTCEDPPCNQLFSSSPSSISSKSSSPLEQLPTFIAPQGLHSLQLPARKKSTKNRFSTPDCDGRHLVPLCEKEVCTQSFRDTSFPASDFHQHHAYSSIRSMLQPKPKKTNQEDQDYSEQILHNHKRPGGKNGGIYGLALDQTMSIHKPGEERKRHSSACAKDMISRRDVAILKNRFCDVQPYSWEEEVRQAMAKCSLSKRPNNRACKGGSDVAPGDLQRSISVKKQYESSALPSTLIIKRTDSPGNVVTAPICAEKTAGAKLIQDPRAGGHMYTLNNGVMEEKRMWKGFSVKSPSEERWEEAAQDEERQELRRRARSQSMRYDTHLRASDLAGIRKADATNAFYNDEPPEWAVYTRSGYVSVRPRKSDADVSSTCCSSLMGRSLSMRDTRMGLVMECAACGTALHGAGGHLLCFCACCAAARSSTTSQATPSAQKKGAGSGILRACRRLLGLSKKRPGNL